MWIAVLPPLKAISSPRCVLHYYRNEKRFVVIPLVICQRALRHEKSYLGVRFWSFFHPFHSDVCEKIPVSFKQILERTKGLAFLAFSGKISRGACGQEVWWPHQAGPLFLKGFLLFVASGGESVALKRLETVF
jgi:hypothetical protein